MNSGKTVLGALAGIAIGAALGILFAPDSGSATRKKISKKSTDYADGLTGKFNEFIEGMTHKFEALKAEATKMAEEGKEKAAQMAENGKEKSAQPTRRCEGFCGWKNARSSARRLIIFKCKTEKF